MASSSKHLKQAQPTTQTTSTKSKPKEPTTIEDVYREAQGKDWARLYGDAGASVLGATDLKVDEHFLADYLLKGKGDYFFSCLEKVERKLLGVQDQSQADVRKWWVKYEGNIGAMRLYVNKFSTLAADARWKKFVERLSSVSGLLEPRVEKEASDVGSEGEEEAVAETTAPPVPSKKRDRRKGKAKEVVVGSSRNASQPAAGNLDDVNTNPDLVLFAKGCKACAENKRDCVGVTTLDRCWTCHRAKKSKCDAPASIPGNVMTKLGSDDFKYLPVPAMDTREGKILRFEEVEVALRRAAILPSSLAGRRLVLHCRMQKGATLEDWFAWLLATPEEEQAEAITNGRVPGRQPGWERNPQLEVGGNGGGEDLEYEDVDELDGDKGEINEDEDEDEEDEEMDKTDSDVGDGEANRPSAGTTMAHGTASPDLPPAKRRRTQPPSARVTYRFVEPVVPIASGSAGPSLPSHTTYQLDVAATSSSSSGPGASSIPPAAATTTQGTPMTATANVSVGGQWTAFALGRNPLVDAIQDRLRRPYSPTPDDQIPGEERQLRAEVARYVKLLEHSRCNRVATAVLEAYKESISVGRSDDDLHKYLLEKPAPGTAMNREGEVEEDEEPAEPMDVEEVPRRGPRRDRVVR
ncbi:hypothetical protein SCHPADRAFT_946413 [Schizopora paradoxa]|uniref:Uncharacterized protein n=1 Tax=Schizopora paradoxa TaxID=27342 RepID=A0A0H2RMJ1_9AGAM|nr:hypothetical protein SCHPADRAFT_946413 [Schizopora paradoxa]